MAWRWAVVCLAILAGCGGGEEEPAAGPDALGYVPRDALVVAIVPTDLESQQVRRLERLLRPALGGATLREAIEENFGERVDLDALLGGDLVVAASGDPDEPQGFAVLETDDGERAHAELRRLGIAQQQQPLLVDGDMLLFGLGATRADLEAAIERRKAGEGLQELPGGLDEEALVRAFGDPRPFVRVLLPGAEELPWIAALRSFELSLTLEADAISGHARVVTDPAGLDDGDLPLAPGAEAPATGTVDGAIAGANRDQSHTTVFLSTLARRALPDSRFVREVERLEAELGITFEQEVLAQFDGPSASVATPDGAFAAVSDVADPERMRALLPELAPRLPPVLRGLERLGSRGLLALLLIAPDAPLTPAALSALAQGVEVSELPGAGDELLFTIDGLDAPSGDGGGLPGPGTVVFGMIGDRFVVATDRARARAVAMMEVAPLEGAAGAAVARTDLRTWAPAARQDALGLPPGAEAGAATGELEASTDGLEGRLRIEIPGGLD